MEGEQELIKYILNVEFWLCTILLWLFVDLIIFIYAKYAYSLFLEIFNILIFYCK